MTSEMVRISLQGTLLALIVLALTTLLKNRLSARTRFALWALVMLRFLLPFAPSSEWSLFTLLEPKPVSVTQTPEVRFSKPVTEIVPEEFGETREYTRNEEKEFAMNEEKADVPKTREYTLKAREYTLNGKDAIIGAWFLGVFALLGRVLWGEISLARRRKNWIRVTSGPIWDLYCRCQKELSLRRNVALFLCPERLGAASYGVLRPAILLSRDVGETFSLVELRLILLHELMHHKRCDPLTNFLSQLLVAVHWPNPFAWLVAARLRSERELCVDETILHRTGLENALAYGETILKAARHYALVLPAPNLLGVRSIDRFLERRITMIITPRKSTRFSTILSVLLLSTLALTGLTNAKPQTEKPENNATPVVVEEIQGEAEPEIKPKTLSFISGTLVDEEKNPVPFAEIRYTPNKATSSRVFVTNADENGRFLIEFDPNRVKGMRCTAFSSDDTLTREWGYNDLGETPITDATVTMSLEKRFVTGNRVITGIVTDANGKPVPHASVGCSTLSGTPYTETDSSGKFKLLLYGQRNVQQLYALKSGAGFNYIVTEEGYGSSTEVPKEKRLKNPVTLVLKKPQTVKVLVKNEQGTPLPNCMVRPWVILLKDVPQGKRESAIITSNLYNKVFLAKTDAQGIATFDWLPTQDLAQLEFSAFCTAEGVLLPNGKTEYYYDTEDNVVWKPESKLTEIVLHKAAKVVFEFVTEKGEPAEDIEYNVTIWPWNTAPFSERDSFFVENGRAERLLKPHDRVDVFFRARAGISNTGKRMDLICPTQGNLDAGDGEEVKTYRFVMKPATRVYGTLFSPEGKEFDWDDKYDITCKEINPSTNPSRPPGIGFSPPYYSKTLFEGLLAPGEYHIKVTPKDEQLPLEERYEAEATLRVTNETEIRMDLQLKKAKQ